MDNTGKVILALGLAGLTGAAIQSSIENRNKENDRLAENQRKLRDTVEDQRREIDRLRKEQNRITEKLEQDTRRPAIP